MFSRFLAWAKEHPVWLGVGVFVVGIALLWLFGFFGRKQVAGSTNNAASYYAAETAANQAAAAQEINRENTLVQVGGIQAQRDVEMAKVEGQTEIARQLAAVQSFGIDAQRDVELAKTAAAADVANTSSANGLKALLEQFHYLSHSSDNALATIYSNNASAVAIEGIHANANENIAINTANYAYLTAHEAGLVDQQKALYSFYGTSARATADVQMATHLDDTNVALALYDFYGKNARATADVQIAVSRDATNLAIQRNITTGMLASEAQTALHGGAGVYGVWTPETGQITVANSSIGGPIDPAVLAQQAAYPWLRPTG